ncbi:MAG: DUF1566 domain-containing protein, partial [Planctomycetes bacterium]|nr:DUF1566 domain-containing protein [Planctomycetota bacterium]
MLNQQLTSTYAIVDTGQTKCYNNSTEITSPAAGQAFYGQDAQLAGNQPSYTSITAADGKKLVLDNVSGLTWMQSPDTNLDGSLTHADKLTYQQAVTFPATLNAMNYGGYNDWRLPSVKELYSLINQNGTDLSPTETTVPTGARAFIDTTYFGFAYGFIGESAGSGPGGTNVTERIIDSQWATATLYVANTSQMFGVNFADGRIKGYPISTTVGKPYHVLAVRGNTSYGVNQFANNGDGTITDNATGLMWSQADSGGSGLNWEQALAWVQTKNSENYLGHNDWRLPDAKELQSIVDYTRSPNTTNSAAIDPLFNSTQITNPANQTDYPFYWASTTHLAIDTAGNVNASEGVYVAFGRAMGYMNNSWKDVHGAGCQRSDPKSGDPASYPNGRGPQGDEVNIYNYVRLVRDAGNASPALSVTIAADSVSENAGSAA